LGHHLSPQAVPAEKVVRAIAAGALVQPVAAAEAVAMVVLAVP
jgi:hypothetical protein